MMSDEKLVVSIPGTLTVPSEPEDHFPMPVRDWKRMRRRVGELQKSKSDFRSAGWTFVGAALGLLVTLTTWFPALSQMQQASQLAFAWVAPVIFVSGGACLVVATIAFLAARQLSAAEKSAASDLAEDMDALHLT